MALKASAVMEFVRYTPEPNGSVTLHFVCADPGPGEPTDYSITVTEAEITAITNMASAGALALSKLKRKYRFENISTKLDSLIGQTVTLP